MYVVARALPGFVAFLSVPLFTHLLVPADYGRYALLIGTVTLLNAVLFVWARLALVRYLPVYRGRESILRSTLLTAELCLIAALGGVALVAMLVPELRPWRLLILPCWGLLACQAVFELFLEHTGATLEPRQYLLLRLTRQGLTVGLGGIFILLGFGWWGPVIGAGIGLMLPILYARDRDWNDSRLMIDPAALKAVSLYGIPLSITVALTVVISTSDRFLIAYLLGDAPAGLYSVASDFTSQTLAMLMMSVHLAMFPLAVRAWESGRLDDVRSSMRDNVALLLALGVPSVAGLCLLSNNVALCFFGKSYRTTATTIIPLIALGTFFGGLTAYHFDSAFQFMHRTLHQVWIVFVAAVANVVLNIVVIPRYGIFGSAMASLLAYVLAAVLTIWVGSRYFTLPFPFVACGQVLLSAAMMVAALLPIRHYRGPVAFAGQVCLGMAVYGVCLVAMNFLGVRVAVRENVEEREDKTSEAAEVLLQASTSEVSTKVLPIDA